MPHDRFYAKNLTMGEEVVLHEGEFHHLVHVMRKKIGEYVELIDGQHHIAYAQIIAVKKASAHLKLVNIKTYPRECTFDLALGSMQPSRLDWVIEKGTEMGVSTFYLFSSKRSSCANSRVNTNRFEKIMISALKQSGRLDMPKITITRFNDLFVSQKERWIGPLYFGHCMATDGPIHEIPSIIVIGPEKGFSIEEIDTLKELGSPISFGPYVLRTDTASIAAASFLSRLSS